MSLAASVPARGSALLAAIGSTPLVEIGSLCGLPRGTRLFGKLESVHPGGSIKDRPVARMLRAALREGRFEGGRRLLDATSGNAGIAYAQLGASLGIGVTLVVPGNASRERLERMRAHGAEVVLTDPLEGYDFALREAARLAREEPRRYWHCDQYSNDENWRAHLRTTGPEILSQCTALLGHAPAAFVCGVGTGGTLTGVGRALRAARAGTFLGCVVPERFPGIEGLKPLGAPDDLVPAILDQSLIDARVEVAHEEAIAAARELARSGFFVGPSSGAFVHAAAHFARERGLESVVVPLCDTGERYRSTGLWSA